MKSNSYNTSITLVSILVVALIVAAAIFAFSDHTVRDAGIYDLPSDEMAIENSADYNLRFASSDMYGTQLENTSELFNEAE